jgi:hypothetical protein
MGRKVSWLSIHIRKRVLVTLQGLQLVLSGVKLDTAEIMRNRA